MVKMGMPEMVSGEGMDEYQSPEEAVAMNENQEIDSSFPLVAEQEDDECEEVGDDQDTEDLTEEVKQELIDTQDSRDSGSIFEQLRAAENAISQAESDVEFKKEELKEAKAHLELCEKKLRRLAQGVKNDSNRPLFNQGGESVAVGVVTEPEPATEESENDDAWRETDLIELDLPQSLEDKLREEGIDNVGELEDFRAAIAKGKKDWPKGIGPAKITTIENAVNEWLSR